MRRTRNYLPAIESELDGFSVSDGHASSVSFPWVEYGQHYGSTGEFVTGFLVDHPSRVADVGGGAEEGEPRYQVDVYWADRADINDMESFRRGVEDSVSDKIESNETSLGDSNAIIAHVTNVRNGDQKVTREGDTWVSYRLIFEITVQRIETY